MSAQISQKVQSLLNKKGFISEIELSEIDLVSLDSEILDSLLKKMNPQERTKKKSFVKTEFSIYKEQNQFMKENNISSLKGTEKERYFSKKRQKIRNQMDSLIQGNATKKEFVDFLNQNFSNPKLENIESFIGGSISPMRKLEILAYIRKLK